MADEGVSEQKAGTVRAPKNPTAEAQELVTQARTAHRQGNALEAWTLLDRVEKDFASVDPASSVVEEARVFRTQLDEELAVSARTLVAEGRAAYRDRKVIEAKNHFDQVLARFGSVPLAKETVEEAKAFRALLDLESPKEVLGPLSMFSVGVLGVGVWVAIALGIAAIFSQTVRDLWKERWLWILAGFLLTGALSGLAVLLERWLAEGTKRTVATFLLIPLITLGMMALIRVGAGHMTLAAQLILILVTALIPAAVYYLFLATRRPSILNEFIGNLSRLGLLAKREVHRTDTNKNVKVPIAESDEERRTRVESYFQRFEARYGTLRFEGTSDIRRGFVTRLIDAVEGKQGSAPIPQPTIYFTDIFHGNLIIPIGLVTVLATLGWLLVLQPKIPTSPTPHQLEREVTEQETTTSSVTAARTPATTGSAQAEPVGTADLSPIPTAVNFAFLGAYFFGLQMLLRRFVRRDLGPNAYLAFATRIIIAVIGVWVLAAAYPSSSGSFDLTEGVSQAGRADETRPREARTANNSSDASTASKSIDSKAPSAADSPSDAADQKTPPDVLTEQVSRSSSVTATQSRPIDPVPAGLIILAFMVGVFPRLLWQFLSALVAKLIRAKVVLPSVEAKQPLSELDGLTVWHESRLEEEDVENIPNMASVDIVELMLHTQIPAERLVSWIDQAILYSALGPINASSDPMSSRGKLRTLGLRSASQVFAVWSGDKEGKAALASVVGQQKNFVGAFVRAMETEANFDLVRAWRRV